MDKELPKSELPKPLGKMHIRVSKSHLPGNESYKGSVVWQRTLDIEDIARRVVEKRSEYRPETLVTTFNLLKREIYDAIEEGFNVDFGFGRTEITLNGSFEACTRSSIPNAIHSPPSSPLAGAETTGGKPACRERDLSTGLQLPAPSRLRQPPHPASHARQRRALQPASGRWHHFISIYGDRLKLMGDDPRR